MLLRQKPLAVGGGGLAGLVLSEPVIRLIDHYSRLDIIMKLSDYIGWLLSPEVCAAIVICAFGALFVATRFDLDRIVRLSSIAGPGDIKPELFKWEAFRSGGLSALIVMSL